MRANEAKTHANSYIHMGWRERESPLLGQAPAWNSNAFCDSGIGAAEQHPHSYPKLLVQSHSGCSCHTTSYIPKFFPIVLCNNRSLKGLFLLLNQKSLNILDAGHCATCACWCSSISHLKLFFLPILKNLKCLWNAYLNVYLFSSLIFY